jgi:hypothetical protein
VPLERTFLAKLNDERRRALRLLARSPNGCTQAILMAHGFPTEMLEELVMAGLAKASSEEMPRGRRKRMKVVWMQITECGRKAILE